MEKSKKCQQSGSHLGYSSERQLSLDLVNVGRQRLDFLPMLEHSGTYRESAMHSGTFAQEIITLVHHVKEQYFQSKGITLNERFSSEQHYSLEDNDDFAEEPEELENMDRPLDDSTSDTQIFCKIGSWQVHQSTAQRRQVPAPGDLRHDLERRRQQRLEGVKITIAGGSFSHVASQNQESEPTYIEEDNVLEAGDDFDWSEQVPQQTDQWDSRPHPEMPASNFEARRNYSRFVKRRGQHIRRNPHNGARW
ncbi:BCLAF1 and THRAP3 family member 3 isoform X4 [Hoplias malabaricus]|uniref:BCLAF1 and THRAP3 family member 3 isoform X4 n=1 Tax=Hoplias malabaricus TaxID=27720 RepID=UPI0034636C6B